MRYFLSPAITALWPALIVLSLCGRHCALPDSGRPPASGTGSTASKPAAVLLAAPPFRRPRPCRRNCHPNAVSHCHAGPNSHSDAHSLTISIMRGQEYQQ
jgi:hypothetical protein